MSRVVVFGSVNFDLIVPAPHIPVAGETVLGSDLIYQPGGKGGNQAVAAHRLGAETALIAAIGDDHFGADLRAGLAAEGIDTSAVTTETGAPTGVALIVVDDAGQNTIVVAPGANRLLGAEALGHLTEKVGNGDVLVLQIEVPISTSLKAAEVAKNVGATVVLNAAPLPADSSEEFSDLLKVVDVLVLNEGEAVQLLGAEPAADRAQWSTLAQRAHRHGPSTVVITLGAQGAVASAPSGSFEQSAFDVAVADTTGAGDAFSGALAVALGRGEPIRDALRFACAAAGIATTKIGAQQALPTAADVRRLLDHSGGGGSDA